MHRQENKGIGKVARFMQSTKVLRSFIFCRSAWREVLMKDARNESEYDLYSAITFLLVGLGIGSLLAIVFNPKPRLAASGN